MSKIVRVHSGNYKIIVGSDVTYGDIVLDTNPTGVLGAQGKVTITGDLEVLGNTTTLQSETLTVKDNIIVINQYDPADYAPNTPTPLPSGAFGGSAGIQIDRGTLQDVSLTYYENLSSVLTNGPTGGSYQEVNGWMFKDASNSLLPIATNAINTNGEDLALISHGNGVITVAGTANYHYNVLRESVLGTSFAIDAIGRTLNIAEVITSAPHGLLSGYKATITCFLDSTFNTTSPVVVTVVSPTRFQYANTGTTVVLASNTGTVVPYPIINDDHIPNMKALADFTASSIATTSVRVIRENDTKVQTYDFDTSGVSKITFDVDGNEMAVINQDGLTAGNIRIETNSITNISNNNILLENVLNIANQTTVPSTPTGYVKLYSTNIPGNGGTGLYFVNTAGTNDELVSKTRALLYALIL